MAGATVGSATTGFEAGEMSVFVLPYSEKELQYESGAEVEDMMSEVWMFLEGIYLVLILK